MNSLAVLLVVAVAAVSAQYHGAPAHNNYQGGSSYGKGGVATSFQSVHLEAGGHDGYNKPSYGHGPSYNKPAYSAGPSYSHGSHAPSYGSHAPSYGSHAPSYGSHSPSYGSHSPSYSSHGSSYGHGSSYKPSY